MKSKCHKCGNVFISKKINTNKGIVSYKNNFCPKCKVAYFRDSIVVAK